MTDAKGEVLYVGKAKNLRRRVSSYAKPTGHSNRIARMIAATAALEIISTRSETEALLLEANLIKRLKPRYNIVLRDDKSFPDVLLTTGHPFPQILKHRGARSQKGEYFGPFASAGAVNRTLNALQKAFLLRSCSNAVFDNRTRPCLLFQIKRCSGPCAGLIEAEDYTALVGQARDFLAGRSREVQAELSHRMEEASTELEFERASVYRDRIRALAQVQSHQGVNPRGVDEADVLAAHEEGGQSCIQVFFFRAGQNWGNHAYYPRHERGSTPEEILSAFITQFYDSRPVPRLVLLSHEIEDRAIVEEALSLKAERRVQILVPQRGEKRELVVDALTNAREALGRRMAESSTQKRLLEEVAQALDLDASPRRIEVYDNSHIQGTNAVGAMIVAGPDGFEKSQYRKFNIKGTELTPGDDYAMMREVLTRRFARLAREDPGRTGGSWPDLVLIDGGAGQLSVARQVFADLGIEDVALASLAKGPDRNAGREEFYMPNRPLFRLEPKSPALYFLQRLRDEAHRFAIGTHRARRSKAIAQSSLDEIDGIGARRKKALLHHFGSARAVERAGLADLEAVEGISKSVARRIHDHFNRER
jgi:excinuclease ABC subunit C